MQTVAVPSYWMSKRALNPLKQLAVQLTPSHCVKSIESRLSYNILYIYVYIHSMKLHNNMNIKSRSEVISIQIEIAIIHRVERQLLFRLYC